ncbi:MAG: cell division protein FtsA [Bacillota bacterium]|nr:cell division protein FtsA [Bacillota bacterium]
MDLEVLHLAKQQIVVGLDIGTSKVTALVGEIKQDEQLSVIGFGESASLGLRKGNIVDIENTSKAIEEAIKKAEQMSGKEITSAYVGISGSSLASLNNRGVVAVSGTDNEIIEADVERVIQAAKVISIPPDRKIIHVLPREFIVDGYNGIMDPVGMAGSRLEVETHIVTGAVTVIQNLLKSISRAKIEVEELVLNPLASAEACLLPAERELGSVIIDIGAGTTDLAIFDQGGLWFTAILPMGGDYITSDMAVGLRTPLIEAEKIKKDAGCVLAELASDKELIKIPTVGAKEYRQVSRKEIAEIIEPRVQELFMLVKSEIKRSGYTGILPGGAVLTGGTSLLDGLPELASEILELPVRVGTPEQVGGLADIVKSPSYATGVGLLIYGAKQVMEFYDEEEEGMFAQFYSKVSGWFRELF